MDMLCKRFGATGLQTGPLGPGAAKVAWPTGELKSFVNFGRALEAGGNPVDTFTT